MWLLQWSIYMEHITLGKLEKASLGMIKNLDLENWNSGFLCCSNCQLSIIKEQSLHKKAKQLNTKVIITQRVTG